MTNDYSRALFLASNATDVKGDLRSHLEAQTVKVSCDSDEGCLRACRILLTTLRRLPLILVLDARGLSWTDVDAMRSAVSAVDPRRELRVAHSDSLGDVQIHIGAEGSGPMLRVIPSRHGAHVVRDNRKIDAAPPSALGSVVAATMAAAEVFKAVVRVRSDRRFDPAHMAFCPVTLTGQPETAPALLAPFTFSGALIGLGAIGTATAMILRELETCGDIDLVDRQRFGKENVPTYSLGGTADAAASVWKTDLANRALTAAHCEPFNMDVAEYVKLVQSSAIQPPRIVLSGLDSIEARHEVQRLWPNLLIDGATGDTMLGLHVVEGAGQPCMMCFLKARNEPSPYTRLAELTGVPVVRLREGDDVLTEVDLANVSEEQRALVAPHIGKKICGLAQAVGLTDIPSDAFQPSIAFVALSAACLVVGRLLATILGVAPEQNFVQYDALFGPGRRTVENRRSMASCYCVTRSATIFQVRKRRFNTITDLDHRNR